MTTSDWIAISSVLVALSAMFIAIWQAYLTRKHNHLSVRPHIGLSWTNVPGEALRCELLNLGVGPAFINKVVLIVGGQEFPVKSYEDYKVAFKALGLNQHVSGVQITHFNASSAVSTGQSYDFMTFCSANTSKQEHQAIAKLLGELEVKVEYKCIYGILYTLNSPPLLEKAS
ncbi:hypothetical protein [Vibrio vulnificus]|uniref:hypothetical protein n=1 Tax=Vibrio vulnificus TaxID=672 RepID=UPI001A238CA4|nr:hypothetical protein [Vibrio vulnificus]WIL72918.1 hypothetical protein QPX65_07955 [Vibrio vulnificus]HAS6046228.1 hypothetical protein [Vibrio vulnificus]